MCNTFAPSLTSKYLATGQHFCWQYNLVICPLTTVICCMSSNNCSQSHQYQPRVSKSTWQTISTPRPSSRTLPWRLGDDTDRVRRRLEYEATSQRSGWHRPSTMPPRKDQDKADRVRCRPIESGRRWSSVTSLFDVVARRTPNVRMRSKFAA